jgi:NAD(P)-dependent dehydrogenase (short-subunit alcohol dehydrogenase family)
MYTNKELVMPTVLITGGHAGLGFEAAKELASGAGLDLLLAGRDPNRIEIAAQKLRSQYGVDVGVLELDLSSLASVRAAAARVRAMLETGEIDSLQAILSNAGAQFQGPVSYSADGYEETFAVNYLGPFLLVNLLLDRVSDGGRIVFTASGTHDPETMDGRMVGAAVEPDAGALALEGKNGEKAISGGKRYTTSKLATVLLAYELDRRLRRGHSSLASIAFDPGLIPETGLARTSPGAVRWLVRTSPMKWVLKRLGVTMGSLSFSGPALARVAYDPSFADGSGKYFQSKNGSLIEARSSKTSYDEERAAKLWRDSEQLVHLQGKEEPALLR